VLLQCRAEQGRLHDRSDPAAWEQAAASWDALGQPYPAARAHFRQAEALLASRAPAPKPNRRYGRHTRTRLGSGQRRCSMSWNGWPSAAASGCKPLSNRSASQLNTQLPARWA